MKPSIRYVRSKREDQEGVDRGCERAVIGLTPSYAVRADPILISALNEWVLIRRQNARRAPLHRYPLYFG